MLVNVFYRKDFGRVEPCDVCAADYDYVCDVRVEGYGDERKRGVDEAFREMNAVDGTETCCKLRVRSMSVGDVAVTPFGVWLCCSVGWEPVNVDVALDFHKRAIAGGFAA